MAMTAFPIANGRSTAGPMSMITPATSMPGTRTASASSCRGRERIIASVGFTVALLTRILT
jgi:hypothetical protein